MKLSYGEKMKINGIVSEMQVDIGSNLTLDTQEKIGST